MWVLNNNLKQVNYFIIVYQKFSETRQMPFFKKQDTAKSIENKHNPVNTINIGLKKARTSEVKSKYKIYGGEVMKLRNPEKEKSQKQLKKLYDPESTFRNKIATNLRQKVTKLSDRTSKTKSFSNNSNLKLEKTLYGTLPIQKTLHHDSNSLISLANRTLEKN